MYNNHVVPAVPLLTSVNRLSGSSARINWIPLTHDEARGILTSLEIAYEPVRDSDCLSHNANDSDIAFVRENLFEQRTANITGLEPSTEYCIAIQVSTSAGESGFSNSIKLSCKICYVYMNYYNRYCFKQSIKPLAKTYYKSYTTCSAHWSTIPNKVYAP